MRAAADILSSAPAMQIRYLETMQAMAKSANSKVIFLPAVNQTMPTPAQFDASLGNTGHATYDEGSSTKGGFSEFSGQRYVRAFDQTLEDPERQTRKAISHHHRPLVEQSF